MSFIRRLGSHLWQNLAMPDRLSEYRELLRAIVGKGYRFSTVEEFALAVRAGQPGEQVCVLRHDVDSDPRGTGRMFDIDRAEGARATYYFRLTTIDRALIARMRAAGSEVGYHFEELATYAKRAGLGTKDQIAAHRPVIVDTFRRNLASFVAATGVTPRTIAAHGDFLNRRLGIPNNDIVDRALLDEYGIVAETYEPWLMSAVTVRLADRAAPAWWYPMTPAGALAESPKVLYILVHPRQWVRAPMLNTGLDISRGGEEIAYRWRCAWRRR